jgi:predicted metal-dependent hydrolase
MIGQDSILFGTTRIRYTIVYSRKRKNASLAVYPLKQVEISVPARTEPELIQNLVRRKAGWVIKQILWFDEISQMSSQKEYTNGETFLYLGRQYRLKSMIQDGKAIAKIIGKYVLVVIPRNLPKRLTMKTIRAAVWQWYRHQANERITDIVRAHSKKLGVPEPSFVIKNQYKRWGSCTSKNLLIFNFRIVMAPMSQIEYVVAHEMCHLRYKDHSDNYWKLLRSIMPDYELRKDRLRKDGWQYMF